MTRPAESPLAERICGEMAQGPVPFRRFMEMALYDAKAGYYRRRPAGGLADKAQGAGPERDPFGAGGDFFTNSQLQPVFGRLIAQQIDADGGTKWAMTPANPTRLYPNFSHGTAGVAYFLATLHQATGEPAFLEAALDGARYLLTVAHTDGDVCLVFHHEPEPEGLELFYLGWCHGPAGTARLFHRLAEIDDGAEWRAWVGRAANGIRQSGIPQARPPGFWQNVGRGVFVIAGLPLGWSLFGLEGVVWVSALTELPVLVILWIGFGKANMLRPLLELRAFAFFGLGAGLGKLILLALGSLGWA